MIECAYTCAVCGIERAPVSVEARSAGEPIEPWLDKLTVALAANHRKRSPECPSTKLARVEIPMNGTDADSIGMMEN